MVRIDARARTDAHNQIAAVQQYGLLERLDELQAGDANVFDAAGALVSDGEFVSTQARGKSEGVC